MNDFENAFRQLVKEALLEVITADGNNFFNRPPEKKEDVFLDAKASADFIGESLSSFYRRTSNNELIFYKRGKRIFCKKSELRTWLEGGKQPSRSELRNNFSSL